MNQNQYMLDFLNEAGIKSGKGYVAIKGVINRDARMRQMYEKLSNSPSLTGEQLIQLRLLRDILDDLE